MRIEDIEVAQFSWGTNGNPSQTTDTSWIRFAELPNADLLIIQHDAGSSTLDCYDSYDYHHFVHIVHADRVQLIIMLMFISFGSEGTLLDIEDLKRRCSKWEVPFTEGGRAIGL